MRTIKKKIRVATGGFDPPTSPISNKFKRPTVMTVEAFPFVRTITYMASVKLFASFTS